MKFAYLRVSSVSQSLERQQAELPNDIDRVYEEKVSGSKMDNRPELNALLLNVRNEDTIWCMSMDRMARSCKDLLTIVETITNKGASVFFKKENLTFTPKSDNSINNLMLGILASISEFERNIIKERQMQGITIAKQKGKFKGGHKKLSPEQVLELKDLFNTSRMPISKIARQFKIGRGSVYRYLESN